nr:hypothetical protein [Isoptericola halotolerans]
MRRPTWRDPRFVIGVVLVALAVALGSWVVADADRTVPVYAAAGTLTPGEPVDESRLRAVDVNLGAEADRYLRVDAGPPDGKVALRVVGDGELVAVTALGDATAVDVRSVAVPVGAGLSERIREGAVVDLWFVPATAHGGAEQPEPAPLVADVVVEQVDVSDGGLVLADRGTLHVLVGSEDLAPVLAALGADGHVAVVPVTGA